MRDSEELRPVHLDGTGVGALAAEYHSYGVELTETAAALVAAPVGRWGGGEPIRAAGLAFGQAVTEAAIAAAGYAETTTSLAQRVHRAVRVLQSADSAAAVGLGRTGSA